MLYVSRRYILFIASLFNPFCVQAMMTSCHLDWVGWEALVAACCLEAPAWVGACMWGLTTPSLLTGTRRAIATWGLCYVACMHGTLGP